MKGLQQANVTVMIQHVIHREYDKYFLYPRVSGNNLKQ